MRMREEPWTAGLLLMLAVITVLMCVGALTLLIVPMDTPIGSPCGPYPGVTPQGTP